MMRSTVELAPDERSPARARRVVRQGLSEASLDHLLDDALLLVTELVTNAAVHAGTALELHLETTPPGVRIEVVDHNPASLPVLRTRAEEEREGGRGLFLVDVLASRWGTTHFAAGKSVWFELERPLPAPAAGAPPRGTADAPSLEWVLALPADLERQLPQRRLQEELVHRLGDALEVDDVWLAEVAPGGGAWSTVAVRGRAPSDDEVEAQRQALLGGGGPVLEGLDRCLVALDLEAGTLGVLGVGAALRPGQVVLARLVAQRLALTSTDAQVAAARTRERGSLALLAEASEMFAGQMDVQLAAALTVHLVVPRYGRWASVHLLEGAVADLSALAHGDEEELPALRAALEAEEGRRYVQEVLARLEPQAPVFVPAPGDAPGEQLLALPLVARQRLLGAFLIRPAEVGALTQDVSILLALTRRAALAVDNARLYQERTAIAQALQAWLLPPALPTPAELDIGARYVAAGAGNDVGGDFYDVFPLPAGGWGIAIGDVCGKGAEAAAITGLARDVLRLLLRRGCTPAQALTELNDAILQLGERGRFCTAAAATLRADGSGLDVLLSVAGHPAPARLGRGAVELVGSEGTLLGVLPQVDLVDDRLHLERDEALVLYTDGVTERRRGSTMIGEAGLLRLLGRAGGLRADDVAGLVEREVTAFDRDPSRDDLAVLVVRATGEQPG